MLLLCGQLTLRFRFGEHALCSSVECFADLPGVTEHGHTSPLRSELDEAVPGLRSPNQQASEVLPAGELESIIEGASENRGQHVTELKAERIARVFESSLFG